jgi:hypothetical protein
MMLVILKIETQQLGCSQVLHSVAAGLQDRFLSGSNHLACSAVHSSNGCSACCQSVQSCGCTIAAECTMKVNLTTKNAVQRC